MKTDILQTIYLCAALMLGTAAMGQAGDDMKAISDDACGCTDKIDDNQDRAAVLEKVNECIKGAAMAYQLGKQLGVAELDAREAGKSKDTTAVTIYVDPDPDISEIQAYMFENCASMNNLISSDNKKNKHSMSENKKALKYYEEGDEHYRREEFDMALVNYNKAVKADPKFAFAWDNMGICYRKMGNYKKAIECYQESLKIDPNGTMPLQNMAVAYEFLKDHKNAAETYVKFIKAFPDDPEGYYGAGRTFFSAEEYEKGTNYMFKAYDMYTRAKSPYVSDAETMLHAFYAKLKELGKESIFEEAAKNNKVEIK